MKHEIAINRALTFEPKGPPERESYALGCDARNDMRPIDENPYEHSCGDHQDWAEGWADADRALDEDGDEGD